MVSKKSCSDDPAVQGERIVYLDYLRVFATLFVMLLHVSGQNWSASDVNGFEWQIFNLFDGLSRWCVPVFVMISGTLFLDRDIPLKKMFSKYISRMVKVFIIWTCIYAPLAHGGITEKMLALIRGNYHMWFILMIIGLYLCVPFLRVIVKSKMRTKYFLFLALIFAFVFPTLVQLVNDFGNEIIIKVIREVSGDVDYMNVKMVMGFSGYYVLGYYFSKVSFDRGQRKVIYILGVMGFVLTILLTAAASFRAQTPQSGYYEYLALNVMLEAVAVYVWFQYKNFDNTKLNTFVRKAAKYSFGAYLVHPLILTGLHHFGLNTLSFNPAASVLSITAIVAVSSFAISAVLNHIPVVKDNMV